MSVHLVGDTRAKLSALSGMLGRRFPLTSELLGDVRIRAGDSGVETVVVAADLRIVDNIVALKQISNRLGRIPRRIFLIDRKSRLSTVQAYALGATTVLPHNINRAQLLAKLADHDPTRLAPSVTPSDGRDEAFAGATCIASMFSSVMSGTTVDLQGVKRAGAQIADRIAESGLSDWLATVRRHHEGTYQHCLLVTGITVDFGLSLGVCRADLEQLYMAAMFHDIGKAKIPLAILDKPGRLERQERALVETHPAAGYEALKANAGISPEILDAVRHHHEYLDGSGYPDGLCATSIPDLVRILTIADIFAALIEHRNYKPTMSRDQAYEVIRGMPGQLEKPLIRAFRDVALTR
jgi:putative nucleotidyltransferase with HDIG domain